MSTSVSTPTGNRVSTNTFATRHIGPRTDDIAAMCESLELPDIATLLNEVVPDVVRDHNALSLENGYSEHDTLAELRKLAKNNRLMHSFVGYGYHHTILPTAIQRGILENPGWYTQYTPYQPEISQGRLEALLIFQTMIQDLTGLPAANASLLDEATAAAEAMAICFHYNRGKKKRFLVDEACHPQTIAVLKTRAAGLGIEIIVTSLMKADNAHCCGILLQYPNTLGAIEPAATMSAEETESSIESIINRAHKNSAMVVMAADILALTLLKSPGEWGADIAIGNTQRFGVPLGFGGPHAAYMACQEKFTRRMPGRIVGISKDKHGAPALRLAMQTREQHIRRERATSNICTAQVLLAIVAAFYGVYHGAEGLTAMAKRIYSFANGLRHGLRKLGYNTATTPIFDTILILCSERQQKNIIASAEQQKINLRAVHLQNGDMGVIIALDETTTPAHLKTLYDIFKNDITSSSPATANANTAQADTDFAIDASDINELPQYLCRDTPFLTHKVFKDYRSETSLMRYMQSLANKDIALNRSMIPLGSCTMKLNPATAMQALCWPEFADIHPFAPIKQAAGYTKLFIELEKMLASITGLHAVSLQPNAGSQGEFAGLMVINAYHRRRGDNDRNICLIPTSAHGTNPASAVMAGMKVVTVACNARGDIDVEDLKEKAALHAQNLSSLMVTYPSTHGVFELPIKEICDIIHDHGGQVYMDGANLNAQVGVTSPGFIGADVCHLNLHKTFAIPHGGGGPGVGPIAVAKHLAPFLPDHPLMELQRVQSMGPVSAAPWGSAGVLSISWSYIKMLGAKGLTQATEVAILNANYMAHKLRPYFEILYKGNADRVAHEFIIDLRPFKLSADITVEDIAKRLMDFGFHAPTMSWPVAGTMMIEPTESESKAEMDRFCGAMIAIKQEIDQITAGTYPKDDNPLKNAPHTADTLLAAEWPHPYSRQTAAYPLHWVKKDKYWPPVGRVDNAYGDRNFCGCMTD